MSARRSPEDDRYEPYGEPRTGVPRWPAALALLVVGSIYAVVSDRLTLGPSRLLLVVVVALLLLLIPTRLSGYHRLTRVLALFLVGMVTVAVAASAILLVSLLPQRGAIPAPELLRDAALIWVTNVVTFAVWYWEIDGGGPLKRRKDSHESEDFLFPQMTREKSGSGWSPGFVDYLFLAFNQSTAFSPTDTAVLSRKAKVLTMIQASLSLVTIAVLAARAINGF